MGDITFRSATREDVGKVLYFIKKLAEYQKLGEEMIATEELLCEWLFEKEKAEVIFCLYDGREIGFAVFYHNFSTMLGRCGIHLEDLYIESEYRGKGCGKALLKKLAAIARERHCGRLEWCCLDWNRRSVEFYLSLGARPMEGWTTYRLSGEALENL